jgi:hypothetical protein
MLRISAILLSSCLSVAAYAQTVAPTPPPAAPPAAVAPALAAPAQRGAARYTPEQREAFKADRKACRDEMRGKSMERGERRKAMTTCLEARNPLFKERMAEVKNRRGEMKEISTACREAMQACIVGKKPEMKKQFECRDEARAKNMERSERRDFMRSCMWRA